MLKKKWIALNTTLVIGLGSSFAIPAINANASTLQSQQSDISQKRADLKSQISDAEIKIVEAEEELAALTQKINRVDAAVAANTEKIQETKEKIQETKKEIAKLEVEIKELKDRIEKRNNILKERARTFQENGGSVDYVEVLLGAATFKDFVDRVGAVATIMEADQDIIADNERDKKVLETKQGKVEDKLSGLNEMKLDLEEMQKQILAQKEQNEQSKKELEQKQQANKAAKAQLEQEDSTLASKESEIKAMLAKKKQEELDALVKSTIGSNASNDSTTPVNTSSSAADNSSKSSTSSNSSSNTGSSSNTSSSSSSETSSKSGSESKKDSSAKINTSNNSVGGGKSTVITAGYKYIGNSTYKFGGGRTASDIANGLFDCSGFVHWAYAQAGYSIGSSTDALKNQGTRVSASNIQPGDLVFFDTYKKDGHVGIYVGGGKFIGSQSSTGVAIASMTSGYWKGVFNGRVVRF
ncbi:C40 family peptidase [Niallia sp. NCCP-28]|uniref:C40 family peptidase n=1 Tax=Niallia sp. NCCP-28 TaxID=2934712 RepID=UPI002089A029|nr:C40 family peptidase [Niallia sp. NCCP-28]GKU82242.1 peptidoglycan DL-endopeptidase CwlO [Niallia sp. NCCP-28]